jgi:hypothetical protein
MTPRLADDVLLVEVPAAERGTGVRGGRRGQRERHRGQEQGDQGEAVQASGHGIVAIGVRAGRLERGRPPSGPTIEGA